MVVKKASVISVALIEDNRLVREGISMLLNQLADVQVVVAETSVDPAQLQQASPQIILLDLGLRDDDSLDLVKKVIKKSPQSKVIVMDLLPAEEEIAEFIRAGVSGFVMKDATFEELAKTIRLVAEGVQVLPSSMTGTLFSQIVKNAVAQGRPDVSKSVCMTPRERQVLYLIAEGFSNKEISSRLHIATHTVKSHVRNIMEKLMLHTRLQIAAYSHNVDKIS